ncbi:MAG: phosphate/phosphite/phosphonate ABC transporter substrate-binding protein [Candidatus Nitrohelix vancouverensis]|uniref:Phosphate/phosphite/phosphonate ABC transporter substrate-binding protein n=1 Tax=Candidatus Nitrohelix vancouverensis TaxID=2705534 RepID=A0A7T0G2D6_9BACT|nr:MAG: phosphate/phosphite/phosphonate ABC transporter substrate-binding protein [Candidatus Nitrohelix vancouverensis]
MEISEYPPSIRTLNYASPEERAETLALGYVTHNPKKHFKRLKPMAEYLAGQLDGIRHGRVLMAKTNEEMVWLVQNGHVDLVFESVGSAMQLVKQADMQLMLLQWKKGSKDYHSLIITHQSSGMKSLADLKGKRITLGEVDSTTSYQMPVAILERAGHSLIRLNHPKDPVPPGKTGYLIVSGDEKTIAASVARQLTDAGAYSNQDWESAKDTPETYKKELSILYQSRAIPRRLVLARNTLPEPIKTALRSVLLDMKNRPDAEPVLKRFYKTRQFDELPREALEQIVQIQQLLESSSHLKSFSQNQ